MGDPEADKFDHSDHSTQHPEPGDLNAPGQLDEQGHVGPPASKERPQEAPTHRG